MYSSTLALHHPLKPHAESGDTLPRLVLESVLGKGLRRRVGQHPNPGAPGPEERRPVALGPSFLPSQRRWCPRGMGRPGSGLSAKPRPRQQGGATQEKAGPARVWEIGGGGKRRKTKK